MRKPLTIAIGAVVALALAAAGLATVFTASGVSATTAAFSADKVSAVKARSCTGGDGKAFTITRGNYSGTVDATNPATELDGPLTIHALTTYSTTDGLGYSRAGSGSETTTPASPAGSRARSREPSSWAS